MIVRNEAAVIERCLDAARPAIDVVSVCDTGSTDDTIATIERWLARNGVPGRVHRHVFRDFGHNRTLSIEAARRTLEELGRDPRSTHLLFLDADMVLTVGGGFRSAALDADVYSVVQRNGALEYPNVRLARASLDARFVGATHEYVSVPAGATEASLATLSIDDLNDGGSRSDKYARDRRLLEDEIAREPGNVRAMFYLAQTCRGMGDVPRALFWYRRRAGAGGWAEEAWYAQCVIGQLLAEAGDARDAARALISAIRLDPVRPEPCFHLAYVLRGLGKQRFAFRIAREGLRRGFPGRDRILFLDREIAEWGLLREISINGYGPAREEAAEANERLALGRGAPAGYVALAGTNAVFYADRIRASGWMRIAPTVPAPYAPCNPSILRTDDGYLINCRTVSYRIDPYQRYAALDTDGILRTRNFLIRTDRDLRFLDEREIVCEGEPLRDESVRGLEDVRLFRLGGEIGFTCTTNEHHPAGYARMAVAMVGRDGPARPVPLQGFGDERAQKNWLPFVDSATGELRAIYGFDPCVELRIDPSSGRVEPAVERASNRNFTGFRGSAGPIDLPASAGGGRLVVVHQVAWQGLRYYLHRFLRFDGAGEVVEASRPFVFLHHGIEFACGAALSHAGDELLVTFGVEDREAWLCRVALDEVRQMLRPLPDWPPRRISSPQ